jgi:hypothetical protein
MARAHDYLPRADFPLLEFAKNFLKYAKPKYTSWSVPSPLPYIENPLDEYEGSLDLAQRPDHSKVDGLNKNVWKRSLEKGLRTYIQGCIMRNPNIDENERALLGLPQRDEIRTPHIEVKEAVEFELRLRLIREVLVNFWVKGEKSKAKPLGYDGAVLIWDILDSPPDEPHSLNRHTMASRTPHTLQFTEEERGKTVYIALAWQNERGLIGAWSEIQSAVIP